MRRLVDLIDKEEPIADPSDRPEDSLGTPLMYFIPKIKKLVLKQL